MITQHGQVVDEFSSFQTPIYLSGPPRDWDAMLRACALWVVAVVGFALGGGAFVSASRNADQAKILIEKANQLTALVDQESGVDGRVADLAEKLKQARLSPSDAAGLSTRQAQLEQVVQRLQSKIDRMAADVNDANEKSALSSARLDKLDDRFSKMELRLAKAEDSEASILKTPAQPSPSPSAEPAAAASAATADDKATTYALAHYSIVGIGKHSVKLSGPDGIVVMSKGDVLPGGQKILKIFKHRGRLLVVTDQGVIASKASIKSKAAKPKE
jgi:hypothetical protein